MKKKPSPFLSQLQKRTAQASMGSSSLRNQGAPGVLSVARGVVANIDLKKLSLSTRKGFFAILDRQTQIMSSSFPDGARNWGAARKGLNLFLRDVIYNKDLCDFYELVHIRRWLEVPLDKHVALGLKAEPEGKHLPRWCGIKKLKAPVSREFQSVAAKVALRKRLERVDLDVYYWRPE